MVVKDSARPTSGSKYQSVTPAKLHLTHTELAHLQGVISRLASIREPLRELLLSSTVAKPDDPSPNHARTLKLDKLHTHIQQQLDLTESLLHQYTSALTNTPASEQRPESHQQRTSAPQPSSASSVTERNISTAWSLSPITVSQAIVVNEVYSRLSKQQRAAIDERIPLIPRRDIAAANNQQLGTVLDLVQSLFRATAREGTATELCRSLDTIPPGIVAYAIAASISHMFQRLTPNSIIEGARFLHAGGAHNPNAMTDSPAMQALKLIKDHTSFVTRFVESSILLPTQAHMRARRIEWWVTAAYLLRELGDYESLNGVICTISNLVVNRMNETWENVPASCKSAVKFIMESVLQPHQNYSSYNAELQERIARFSRPTEPPKASPLERTRQTGLTEQISLDFDKAVSVDAPSPRTTIDEYVYSPVYLKEGADLPAPRTIVPIISTLVKDAMSTDLHHPTTPHQSRWRQILDRTVHRPLSLTIDSTTMRRIFAIEISHLPFSTHSAANAAAAAATVSPNTASKVSTLIKRLPRRSSAADSPHSPYQCRLHSAATPATIVDMLRHLLALAYGNPCHVCRIGAPLVDLHVATAGQLAVHLASSLLLCEPWMPHEYIFRLSDMREPRSSHPPPSKSHALATMAKAKAHAPLNRTHSTTSRGSDRTPEAPWQSSFRVKETSASSHASRSTGRTDTYEKQIKDRVDGQSLYSQSDSLFSESEGNDDGSASSRPSSDGPQVPVFDFGTPQLFTKPTGAPLHSRSKSSSTTNGSTRSSLQAAGILPSLPPLPSNAMPPPLPTANMPTDISPLTADLAKIGIPSSHLSPVLKPILKPHSALPPLPPLPTANMPTDISPLAADLTKMGIPSSHMPPVLKPILKPQNAPPPLPSQPMPSFQPSSYTPQTSSGGFMPMKSAAPPSLLYATESMSAEALMLLNFDKIHK